MVSAGLAGLGGWNAWQSDNPRNRFLALGAASAAGSQLALLAINPKASPADSSDKPPTKPPTPQITASAGATQSASGRKNADLGSLPPGMLDAAFERARAEVAIAGDGYPSGFEHQHHHIPFVP
jgi:hypothetical protein